MPNFGENGSDLNVAIYSINKKMPNYTCERCLQEFTKKDRYDSHLARKNPCKPPKVIKDIIEEKVKEEIRKTTIETIELNETNQQSFFEDLHNLLWNRAGLTPEKALDHMTFFFAYRLIETQADLLKLPQECRWAYLANMNNENDVFETMRKGCESFRKNKVTKPFFKPPEIQKATVVYDVVKLINRISLKSIQETDTLGNIFEYMLGRGMSTMSDEGQYFTNRKICSLAFKLAYQIKGTIFRKDKSLCTFADWFCGTGGFASEYIKGVKNIDKHIDWNVHSKSIYCQDMSTSSVTTTLLNMLITTGVPFSDKTIRSGDSFTEPITIGENAPFKDVVVDYCFMNPPYGGDKGKGKEYKFAYSKGKGSSKVYLVNSEIQSIGIEDDDKVSAGVQLAMATLASKGVCCLVLWDRFFFGTSKEEIQLRKKIIEEYKVHYVIDIPKGSFSNTDTKTTMIVFQKNVGPTEKIKFIDINENVIVETNLEELREKNYHLSYKRYVAQRNLEAQGFQMVKLGDIVNINFGERITKREHTGTKYPVYGGGDETFRTDRKNREGVTCKVSRFGMSEHNCVQIIYGDYWLLDSGLTITAKEDGVIDSYVWNWLLQNKKLVYQCGRATAQMNIDIDTFKSIQIPIPSLEVQQQVVNGDGWATLAKQEEKSLEILEKQVVLSIKELGKGKDKKKLKDVCDFKRGKPLAKKDFVNGNIPVIGGGTKPVGFHNEFNRDPYTILISQSGTAGHISRYDTHVWASDCFSLHSKECILDDYLYYSVVDLQNDIDFLKEGTAQPHVYPSTIEHLEILLPSIEEQKKLQPDFDEIRNKHKKIIEYKKRSEESIKKLITK